MHIAELVVNNFRGIKHMMWRPHAGLNCLIGPGDGTKSTVLSAIELVISPSWSVSIDETDCFDLTSENPITIAATVVDPPRELLKEEAFGLLLRGWHVQEGVHDEANPGDMPALTIRFTLTVDCEPQWHVIVDREPQEKAISAKQRALCNLARIDTVDRHLTWSPGSLLTKATANHDEAATTFASAAKAARAAFRTAEHPKLANAASALQAIAKQYGARPRANYTAALDSKAMQLRAGCLTLHDAVVPSRLFGLGTRRILALALQGAVTATPGIALIDEFEHGLEPHRIRRLLRTLKTFAATQIFMTTHSPVCVHELAAEGLCIVRSKDHVTTVKSGIELDLRKTIQQVPESLLARRIVVCEGATEVGMIHALDDHWTAAKEPLASLGVLPIDGGGTSAPKRARELKALGYDVMVFGDSDDTIAKEAKGLEQNGIPVIMWPGAVCTEQSLFSDLPWDGVQALLTVVLNDRDEQSIRSQLQAKRHAGSTLDLKPPLMTLPESKELRDLLGRTAGAKTSGWYKQLHLGEEVGRILAAHLATTPETNTGKTTARLEEWLYRE